MKGHELLNLTVDIVASWAAANESSPADLLDTLGAVHQTLKSLVSEQHASGTAPSPAVPIRRSVTPDYLVCLEDGKRLKTLKRHLRTAFGMSPDEYRRKWGLPHDYPMVAPNYAATRSALARSIGLGGRRRAAETTSEKASQKKTQAEPGARRRARKKTSAA